MTTAALPTLKTCRTCQAAIATSWDGFCPTHSGYRPLREYSSRPPAPRSSLSPIGVELELVHPEGVHKLTPIERYVCSDGSLPSNGGEIKLCSPSNRVANRVADTIQRAAIAGCRSHQKAGMHVHLSHPFGVERSSWNWQYLRSPEWVDINRPLESLTQWGGIVQDYLFGLMPPSRRDNHYCRKLGDGDSWACITSHYAWLSWSQRIPTVEVRLHGSTANPLKGKAWVEVCLAIRERINRILHPQTRDEELELASSIFERGAGDPKDYLTNTPLGRAYLAAREKTPSLREFGGI